MKLPKFSDLADEQLNVYLHPPEESMLVVGPPGSGKTSMAIWRGRLLMTSLETQSVMLITKNRLLSAVAGSLALEENGLALPTATMHTFVANHYWTTFRRYAPKINDYDFDWERILQDYSLAKIEPTLDHIIIDEGQNLPHLFFSWIHQFGAYAMSIFADEHQTTDRDSTTIAYLMSLGFTEVFPLLINHRNTASIANLVGTFHINSVIPKASVKRGRGSIPTMVKIQSWNELAELAINRYQNRRESIGVIVYRVSEVELVSRLIKARLPNARVDEYTYQAQRGREFGIQIRDEGVTIISGQSAIGLEFDTLYLQDLSRSLPLLNNVRIRRLYMLCARARENLYLINGPQPLSEQQLSDLPIFPILQR